MSLSRAAKDPVSELDVKQKKFTRLLYNKNLSQKDSTFINYVYEEKINLHYWYAIGFNLTGSIILSYLLFKQNRPIVKVSAMLSLFGMSHLWMSYKINCRFEKLLHPYYEKYKIK
eukprot:TRINITY_DN3779_c0_g1_i6.p1 TRINITY_DN3779_c0_g1~~TRINITY_DN3779_c0_g1_i6.p1  ORF type:complete len:115 (+),score=23.90 TRINITY_DN3779_c0_g1_i6:82-426(+)